MRRFIAASLLLTASVYADTLRDHIRASGQPPADYILAKTAAHRIVILGENHFQKRDPLLVASLIPQLRARRVALAMEMFNTPQQENIDKLLAAAEWDVAAANSILQASDWPYLQYRDILEAAWCANRAGGDAPPLRVLAIGPPPNWREIGIGYDRQMAEQVMQFAKTAEDRVLVYCGMHHAFTRYLQVERLIGGRPMEFMDRFGNILWRRWGENVFLIALHKPEWCGPAGQATQVSCSPFGGSIDCAAGGKPVAFDVLRTPVAELPFPRASYYALGYPHLRFVDYTDGYVWVGAVDEAEPVDIVELPGVPPEESRSLAKSFAERREKLRAGPAGKWREQCPR